MEDIDECKDDEVSESDFFINSLAPGIWECDFEYVLFKLISMSDTMHAMA